MPGAAARSPQPGAQDAGRSRVPAGGNGLQPRGHLLPIHHLGGIVAAEAGQERQADRAVQLMEQADRGRERRGQVRAQLVTHRHPVRDQVPAGPH
jgi:hypothetical protein